MNGEQEQENSNCTGALKAVDEDHITDNTITLSSIVGEEQKEKKREKKRRSRAETGAERRE
jgi:hypothetical protein